MLNLKNRIKNKMKVKLSDGVEYRFVASPRGAKCHLCGETFAPMVCLMFSHKDENYLIHGRHVLSDPFLFAVWAAKMGFTKT